MVSKSKVRALITQAVEKALLNALPLVQEAVDTYVKDLERNMGVSSPSLGWMPLDPDSSDDKFWYETGSTSSSLVSSVSIAGNKIIARAGLPSSAEHYQEALWNEFGWMPRNSTKLIRRALFIPLAEMQLRELNTKLTALFSNTRLSIKVKI